MKIKVSVIIATYNREIELVNAISSVLSQRFEGFELLVVDQTLNHDPKTKKFLTSVKDLNFKYFLVTPPSLPAARNFALQRSLGEIVIFIDDDVVLDQDFIAAHYDSYQKHPEIAAVAGRIKEKGKGEARKLLTLSKANFIEGSFDYGKEIYSETLRGCNMSFCKNILEKIGGFDSNYIGNALREDSDVAARIRERGYKILFNPQASLLHLFSSSGGSREEQQIIENYIYYRNDYLFFLRHQNWLYAPYYFYKNLRTYVYNKTLLKKGLVWSRFKVFIRGIVLGKLTFFFPSQQIVSQEVK